MEPRSIGPAAPISGGDTWEVTVDGLKGTMFVPEGCAWPGQDLWIHFHTAPWFIVQEHQRSGFKMPLLVLNWGQGSTTYANPMKLPGALKKWVDAAATLPTGAAQEQQPVPFQNIRLHVSSFSAGYGAVREILIQDPSAFANLKTLILCDSMYGSLIEGVNPRTVAKEHIAPWRPVAERAIKGECTFITTTTMITPQTYASTWEVAQALVRDMGFSMTEVAEGSIAAAKGEQKLLKRFDSGRFHVWSYAGDTAESHMTHPRRLAELMQVALRK